MWKLGFGLAGRLANSLDSASSSRSSSLSWRSVTFWVVSASRTDWISGFGGPWEASRSSCMASIREFASAAMSRAASSLDLWAASTALRAPLSFDSRSAGEVPRRVISLGRVV